MTSCTRSSQSHLASLQVTEMWVGCWNLKWKDRRGQDTFLYKSWMVEWKGFFPLIWNCLCNSYSNYLFKFTKEYWTLILLASGCPYFPKLVVCLHLIFSPSARSVIITVDSSRHGTNQSVSNQLTSVGMSHPQAMCTWPTTTKKMLCFLMYF